MALKRLDVREMVGLTDMWTRDARPIIESIALVAAFMPHIDEVHARVKKAQPPSSEQDSEVARITEQQVVIDARFGDLIRGVSRVLEGEKFLCLGAEPPQAERAEACEKALLALLPDGLNVVRMVHAAEAGQAARVRELISTQKGLRDLLASIPVSGGGSLLSVVEHWCGLGEQLSKLEHSKSEALAQGSSHEQVTRSEIVAARNAWISVVNAVLTNLALVKDNPKAVETLRGPVLRLAENAGKRGGAGDRVQEEDESPAAPATPAAPAAPGKPGADEIEPGMPGAKPFI